MFDDDFKCAMTAKEGVREFGEGITDHLTIAISVAFVRISVFLIFIDRDIIYIIKEIFTAINSTIILIPIIRKI